MGAVSHGADADGRTIGLNIGLPSVQRPNPYITPGLSFGFYYVFTRKLSRDPGVDDASAKSNAESAGQVSVACSKRAECREIP